MTDPNTAKVCAAQLHKVRGGILGKMIDQKLTQCQQDIEGAPRIKKARKVIIEVDLIPDFDDELNELAGVRTEFNVSIKVPKRGPVKLHAQSTRQGLVYQPLEPEDARQMVLPTIVEDLRDDGDEEYETEVTHVG